jgi:regulator of nucleoside diphosphate kinase
MGLLRPEVLLCPEHHLAICEAIADVGPSDGTRLLSQEAGRARLVPLEKLPADTVRLNSTVIFLDNEDLETEEVQVVLTDNGKPLDEAPVTRVLGAALIGLRVGDTMRWVSRTQGEREITITRVTQPAPPTDLLRNSSTRN